MVYIRDIHGNPLMPTERHGKVRRLLKSGQAHVVSLMPFTIQLDYATEGYTQNVNLGVDPGAVHIGISATTTGRELFAAEFLLRTDIVKRIASRKEARQVRKARNKRHSKKRYDNRKRVKKWLSPSIKARIDCHIKAIKLVHTILPVSKTTIEVAGFDIKKIKYGSVQGAEYQLSEFDSWNIREYVLARDRHTCQYCKGKSGDTILNVHHIESRQTGGNAPNNLITLCKTCHVAYHAGKIKVNAMRGRSFRNEAIMNVMKWTVCNEAEKMFSNVHSTFGYLTKHFRIKYNIEKTHCADAFCIAGNYNALRLENIYIGRFFPRHERALHDIVPKKKGFRKRLTASHWILDTRFQKHDVVEFKGNKSFIFGRCHRYVYLKDIFGTLQTEKKHTHIKNIRFVRRKRGSMLIEKYSKNNINNLKI